MPAKNELSEEQGHKLKSLMLSLGALKRGSGELSVFDDPPLEYCEERAGILFERAEQDDDAFRALCLIASRLLWRGKALPPLLAAFASLVLPKAEHARRPEGEGDTILMPALQGTS